MALILNLSEGDDLFVCNEASDQQLIIEHIVDAQHYVIRAGEALHNITYEQTVEVLPNVRLFIGKRNRPSRHGPKSLARLGIEAPESTLILTGENYRKETNCSKQP